MVGQMIPEGFSNPNVSMLRARGLSVSNPQVAIHPNLVPQRWSLGNYKSQHALRPPSRPAGAWLLLVLRTPSRRRARWMLGAVVPRRGRLFEYATSGPLFREHGGDSPRLLAIRAVFQTGQSGCCYGSNWPMAERGSGKFKSRPARPGAVAACCGRQEVVGPAAEVRGRAGGAACGPEEPAVVACGCSVTRDRAPRM